MSYILTTTHTVDRTSKNNHDYTENAKNNNKKKIDYDHNIHNSETNKDEWVRKTAWHVLHDLTIPYVERMAQP